MHQVYFILEWHSTCFWWSFNHQEFKTAHTATGICQTDTAVCLLAGTRWNCSISYLLPITVFSHSRLWVTKDCVSPPQISHDCEWQKTVFPHHRYLMIVSDKRLCFPTTDITLFTSPLRQKVILLIKIHPANRMPFLILAIISLHGQIFWFLASVSRTVEVCIIS